MEILLTDFLRCINFLVNTMKIKVILLMANYHKKFTYFSFMHLSGETTNNLFSSIKTFFLLLKMTEQERRQNNNNEPEKEKENETYTNLGRPLSGVWKHFDRGESRGEGHWEGTCQYCKKFYPHAKPNYLRAHLANNCKKVPEEWRHHFNYILVNDLNDIPTDKPLTSESDITQDWEKPAKVVVNQSESMITEIDTSIVDEAISLAFIMCGIPFRVISNPFFINVLKILNPSYNAHHAMLFLGDC